MVSIKVGIIIGIDHLYSKAKYKSAFNHPNLGLQIANTIFGHTLCGILNAREENLDHHPIELRALTTLIVDKKELSKGGSFAQLTHHEPTIIYEEDPRSCEEDIKQNLMKIFDSENPTHEENKYKSQAVNDEDDPLFSFKIILQMLNFKS